MSIASRALSKVLKWRENGISKYRISKELNVTWVTVQRWIKKQNKPGIQVSKNIMETEIEK